MLIGMPSERTDGVSRFDFGELEKPERYPNGWMHVDGYLTRVGVFAYRRPDGSTQKEFRPPDEVFKADSLKSFAMVPLTNGHPIEGLLTAENTRRYQIGTVEMPKQDGNLMRAGMLVTDSEGIAALEGGRTAVSCGYLCDLEHAPGEYQGQHYDSIQRNIRGNHVALVDKARAGDIAKVRLDAADGAMILSTPVSDLPDFNKRVTVKKIRIDGVDYEVPEAAAQAFAKVQEDHGKEIKAKDSELSKAQAKADALETELKQAKSALAESPAKVKAEIAARVALETKAASILGSESKLDGVADMDVKRKVIQAVLPSTKLDGKSDAYVEATYDLALEKFAEQENKIAEVRSTAAAVKSDASDFSADSAREKFYAASRNAHRPTPAK